METLSAGIEHPVSTQVSTQENLEEVVAALRAFQIDLDIGGESQLAETACCTPACAACGWCSVFCFVCAFCTSCS